MRMKLGTLKRIIREAVGEVLGEGSREEEAAATHAASNAYWKWERQQPWHAANREREEKQAANAAANIEREKARAAAWPARDKKYLAVLDALPAALSAAHGAQPLEKQLPDFNPKDAAFRLKLDINRHAGLDNPDMTVEDIAADIAKAAVIRITGPKGRYGTRYSYHDSK